MFDNVKFIDASRILNKEGEKSRDDCKNCMTEEWKSVENHKIL